jgi:hypothetical protein
MTHPRLPVDLTIKHNVYASRNVRKLSCTVARLLLFLAGLIRNLPSHPLKRPQQDDVNASNVKLNKISSQFTEDKVIG